MAYLITDAEVRRNGTTTTTEPASVRKGTPNWLKAFYATLAALVLITALGMIPQFLG